MINEQASRIFGSPDRHAAGSLVGRSLRSRQ